MLIPDGTFFAPPALSQCNFFTKHLWRYPRRPLAGLDR